ncbi:hypothetical protein KUCAC02_020595 [Chaenocephalus aceratus]|nr:hypothetical protein KUCAC02_020595 [Chaenocephalus aceratus]
MNSLSKQVSLLSQELQEMTRLLKPLLQQSPPPILMTMMPNLTPPPSSSASQLSTSNLLGPRLPVFFFLAETRLSLPVGRGRHRGCGFARMPLTTPLHQKGFICLQKLKSANPSPPSLEEGLPEGAGDAGDVGETGGGGGEELHRAHQLIDEEEPALLTVKTD